RYTSIAHREGGNFSAAAEGMKALEPPGPKNSGSKESRYARPSSASSGLQPQVGTRRNKPRRPSPADRAYVSCDCRRCTRERSRLSTHKPNFPPRLATKL